ncbi:TonB dependent receptor [compost metagenome]
MLGLRGSWTASQQIRVDLKLDNLLDKGYSRALYSYDNSNYGYREEGRTWLLSLTWTPAL